MSTPVTEVWAIQYVCLREGNDYRDHEETTLEDDFGFFLTEDDAKRFLTERGRDRATLQAKRDADDDAKDQKAEHEYASALIEYNKARAAGVPARMLVTPVKPCLARRKPVDSYHEPVRLEINAEFYEGS